MKPWLVFQRRKFNAEFNRLVLFTNDRDVDGLIGMLDSDVRGVTRYSIIRMQAADLLAKQGDPRAVPHLVEMRHDPEEMVRFTVMTSLGKLKADDAEGVLLEGLIDPSPLVRSAAAGALGRVGTLEAIPALRRAVDSDPDKHVRASAVEALVILGDEQSRSRVPEVLDALGWRGRIPRWKPLREAAESGGPLTPWVNTWEKEADRKCD